MKANELRIGNWYGEFGIPKQVYPMLIVKLSQIEQANKIAIDVEDIPLTEEWLMKFEFEKHPTKDYYYHDCGEYVIRVVMNAFSGTIDNDSSWFISIQTGFASQPVTLVRKYVHQLQNLYHALTGEEL